MSIRQFRPMTAGTRFRSVSGFDEITATTPEKSLLEPMKKSGGRNNQGHLTSRHRGGGHKRQYRKIDFKRDKFGDSGPGRGDRVRSRTGPRASRWWSTPTARSATSCTRGAAQGDTVVSGPGADTRTGNALPLGEIPLGTTVHNVELKIGKGGQICRTAGSSAQVVAKEGDYVTLRLRSTEMRLVHGRCLATVGEVGNAEHELLSVGKAGKSRWLGQAAQGPRRGDEPGRSPAGRRRGQELRRPSADVARGASPKARRPGTRRRLQQADRARPQAREGDADR